MTTLENHPYVLSTRDDPHAQAREARHQPLLLHSMSVFREIFELLFAQRDISTVVEVGVESGKVSRLYAELGASAVYCIDPHPTDEIRTNLAANKALHLIEQPSPEALAEVPIADLYVLDGDHNYAVVRRELDWIFAHAPDAVVVLHDVLWPWSRRDLYYEPSILRAEDKHPSSEDGPTIWHDDLTPAGFVGLGAFTASVHAGGERNGVLTAVEDALSHTGHDTWRWALIPAVFGMGVLIRQHSPGATELIHSLRPYCESRLLATMENNRIALYTRVLQLQYEAVAHADNADKFAEEMLRQHHDIERLQAELASSIAQHTAEKTQLQRENAKLVRLLEEQAARPWIKTILAELQQKATTQLRKLAPPTR